MKIAILTSPDQWFVPYAKKLQIQIEGAELYFNHKDISENFEIIFILSYHKIIEKKYLTHTYNVVVHASSLPKGKGWAPMFWQILEDKNTIPFSLFEASSGIDNGDIYMRKELTLNGYELHDELRHKQAEFISQLCLEFMESEKLPLKQKGEETFYKKRSALDAELDINKSIKEQFNLLRVSSNSDYPAFFEIAGKKYTLKIEHATF